MYEAAKNGAAQQYQMLQAARARVSLAQKAFADTAVRAPFNGVIAQRLVSVGDYVTKGMKVAVVVRVNPLRALLTVPEQSVSSIAVGQPIMFEVDAYAGRTVQGTVKYVAPALQADQRSLTVEAIVPNVNGELKPGLFATARIEQAKRTPGVLVPPSSVLTTAGTSRVYVVNGDHVEERIVTTGDTVGALVEVDQGPEGRRTRGDDQRRPARRRNQGELIMQWLAALCVKRPVFATVLILSLTVVGAFSFSLLGVDRFPKVDIPTIVITTVQPGGAPEQIETEITDKIEEGVNTISGIDELRSTSSEGISLVSISFTARQGHRRRRAGSARQDQRRPAAAAEDDSAAARRSLRSGLVAGPQPGAERQQAGSRHH